MTLSYFDAISYIREQIGNDRHVDINYSSRYSTFEFRVFNSTTEAWQMELAARLTVAFCKAVNGQHFVPPRNIRIPARALQTMQPPLTFDEFVAILTYQDAQLRRLIERQSALHPDRDITGPPETSPDPMDEEAEAEDEAELCSWVAPVYYGGAPVRADWEELTRFFARLDYSELPVTIVSQMFHAGHPPPAGMLYNADGNGLLRRSPVTVPAIRCSDDTCRLCVPQEDPDE